MTKTTNYQLPQWEAHDPIRRGDFNAAMGAIDAGIAAAQTAAEGAQTTADTARTEAAALPYVTGTYRASQEEEKEIVVGFKPSFLLIFSTQGSGSTSAVTGWFSAFSEALTADRVTFTETGFRLAPYDSTKE